MYLSSMEMEIETACSQTYYIVFVRTYKMCADCIDRGTFLDNQSVKTLEEPEKHSFHCLLDVPQCKSSGYLVLGDKNPDTGMHCLGYRLGDTNTVLAAGLAAGRRGTCTDCTGDDTKPNFGYKATIKGTIKDMGDGSDGTSGAPLLENIEVWDASVGCEGEPVVPPLCAASVAKEDAAKEDCALDFCSRTLSDDLELKYKVNVPSDTTPEECAGCTMTMELTYDGEAWVAIGFSNDGLMIGSEAVIASPDLEPLKYNLGGKSVGLVTEMPESQQTLIDPSVRVEDGKTIATFTKIMKEPDEIEIKFGDNTFLWANGAISALSIHTARGPFGLNLSGGESAAIVAPYKSHWLSHGICAFIAWGVLSPLAVNASLWRNLLPDALWFDLHRWFNQIGFTLCIVLFVTAVVTTNSEGSPHFKNAHQIVGLAMFIMAILQVFMGCCRPHNPEEGEEKTTKRKAFEIGHRVLGVTLLACGFWQMSAGIELFAVKYSVNEKGLLIAYWVWVGIMSAGIVLGGGKKLKSD